MRGNMNSHSVAAEADREPSNIERKIDRALSQANRLDDLLSRARNVLKPALTPENIVAMAGSACGGDKASSQSPLAEQLDSLAKRIERQGDDLRDLLDRFEA